MHDIRNRFTVQAYFDLELTANLYLSEDAWLVELSAISRPIVRDAERLTEHTVDDAIIDEDAWLFHWGIEHLPLNASLFAGFFAELGQKTGDNRYTVEMSETALSEYWDIFPDEYKSVILSVGSGWLED